MTPTNIQKSIPAATAYLRQQGITALDVGLILGSGLGTFAEKFDKKTIIPYADIPGFVPSTVAGHKGQFVYVEINGLKVLMMQGRWHLYEGHEALQVALPVLVMHELGAKTLIVTTASGGLNPLFEAGDLMLIRDHVNFQFRNPLRGFNWENRTPWVDMAEPFSNRLADMAKAAAREADIYLREGVYISGTGPNYETNAEIKMLRMMGDAISMSTIPEVLMARYLDMEVLGITCITNKALPVRPKTITHEEVIETGQRVAQTFGLLMTQILTKLSQQSPTDA